MYYYNLCIKKIMPEAQNLKLIKVDTLVFACVCLVVGK